MLAQVEVYDTMARIARSTGPSVIAASVEAPTVLGC